MLLKFLIYIQNGFFLCNILITRISSSVVCSSSFNNLLDQTLFTDIIFFSIVNFNSIVSNNFFNCRFFDRLFCFCQSFNIRTAPREEDKFCSFGFFISSGDTEVCIAFLVILEVVYQFTDSSSSAGSKSDGVSIINKGCPMNFFFFIIMRF